mgnify:CR=1 FL=1
MIDNKTELLDKELEKINGGLAFDYNQCPCNNFEPYDGNWSNTSAYNCKFYVQAREIGTAICNSSGVCKNNM